MFEIANIFASSTEDFIDWSKELAEECLSSAPELRDIIAMSNINNKDYFLIVDDRAFIQYALLCLAYGQLEPGLYQDPHCKSIISAKVSTLLKYLGLDGKGIAFVNSVEDRLMSVLGKARAVGVSV